ncbi:hypothetical protein E1258_13170 [Micromonospora sp. KC207]|uniref:hypothetical protein n=1 Tax=Micromonospora sp. KC207 TaxID=2530377 RepID=UPI00104FCF92|nr:hypothetical protein [Micromonospora sp. KC207]TDC60920.1 hypothetical protein E1258_13170 [Micromonospora sp. KC207]
MSRRVRGRDVLWGGACLGLGAWLVASVASQHPQRVFDRVRRYDVTGTLIPDWRFLAPEPAQHDFVLLRRTLEVDGTETPWVNVVSVRQRAWSHGFWFPRRRLDKAIFDLCDQLTRQISLIGDDGTSGTAYKLLCGLVERHVRTAAGAVAPKGFQFMLARSSGYDSSEEPEYVYLSRFEKL